MAKKICGDDIFLLIFDLVMGDRIEYSYYIFLQNKTMSLNIKQLNGGMEWT